MWFFFIDPDIQLLRASPDVLEQYKYKIEGLLGMKCFLIYQRKDPKETCINDHHHVTLDEIEDARLKIDSPWFVHKQGQLGVYHKN